MVDFLLNLRFIMYKINGSYQRFNGSFYDFMGQVDVPDESFFMNCLLMHEACNWWDARPRGSFGTVEVRVFCQQPPQDGIAVHALVLGIACNIERAVALMNEFAWSEWIKIRDTVQYQGLRSTVRGQSIIPYLDRLVQIAYQGLESRGLGEENFLYPLLKRLYTKTMPSDHAIQAFEKDGVPGIVDKFAYRL
jgi:gamma-glutamylcysteine synthetase